MPSTAGPRYGSQSDRTRFPVVCLVSPEAAPERTHPELYSTPSGTAFP